MTERALGKSTESITGNKSNGKMLLLSFRGRNASDPSKMTVLSEDD